jgi:hypothetical protein
MAAQLMDLTYPNEEAGASYPTCDAGHDHVAAGRPVVLRILTAVHR